MERITRKAELRAEGRKLSGDVMRYGDVSPTHRERFEPGSIALADCVPLNFAHDQERALGWHPDGRLELRDSEESLTLEIDLPKIPLADRVLAEVRGGKRNGLSVEFESVKERRDGAIRVIEQARLVGIGIVENPSYEQSQVEARDENRARKLLRWL